MLDDEFFDRFFGDEDDDEGESWDEFQNEEGLEYEYVEIDIDDILNYSADIPVDIVQSPSFKLGMYKKLVLNHIDFKDQIVKFFKRADSDLSPQEMDDAGNSIAYDRAWNYISLLDIEEEDTIKAIYTNSDEDLIDTLNLGIKHYEVYEEYERCAFLLKILKKSHELTL